jgi:hypothetical protein
VLYRSLIRIVSVGLLLSILAACGGTAATTAPSGNPTTVSAAQPTAAPAATKAPAATAVPAATATKPPAPTAAPTEAPVAGDPQEPVVAFVTAFGAATQDLTIGDVATQEKWADEITALVAPAKRGDVRKELLESLASLAESNRREIPGVPADAEIQLALAFDDLETTIDSETATTAKVSLSGGVVKGVFVGKDVDKVPADVKSKAEVEQPVADFFGSNSTFDVEKVDGVWYLSNPLDTGASGDTDTGGGTTDTTDSAAGASRATPLALSASVPLQTWALTITEVLRGDEALKAILGANQFNEAPAEGFEYVLATIELTNIGKEEAAQDASSAVSMGITGDKNILYPEQYVVVPTEFEGELFTGASAVGQKAFLVPSDEGNLMFYVRDYSTYETADQRFIALSDNASIVGDDSMFNTPSTDVGSKKATPAPLGDSITSANWEVKVLEVKRGDEAAAMVKEASEYNDPPADGMEYVAVRIAARYLGDSNVDEYGVIDGLDFSITGAKNVVYEKVFVTEPVPALSATLFPGAETEGWEILSVPTGETKLALVYEPTFSDDDIRYLGLE